MKIKRLLAIVSMLALLSTCFAIPSAFAKSDSADEFYLFDRHEFKNGAFADGNYYLEDFTEFEYVGSFTTVVCGLDGDFTINSEYLGEFPILDIVGYYIPKDGTPDDAVHNTYFQFGENENKLALEDIKVGVGGYVPERNLFSYQIPLYKIGFDGNSFTLTDDNFGFRISSISLKKAYLADNGDEQITDIKEPDKSSKTVFTKTENGVTLKVELDKPEFKVGDAATAKVTVTNNADGTIYYIEDYQKNAPFTVDTWNSDGEKLPYEERLGEGVPVLPAFRVNNLEKGESVTKPITFRNKYFEADAKFGDKSKLVPAGEYLSKVSLRYSFEDDYTLKNSIEIATDFNVVYVDETSVIDPPAIEPTTGIEQPTTRPSPEPTTGIEQPTTKPLPEPTTGIEQPSTAPVGGKDYTQPTTVKATRFDPRTTESVPNPATGVSDIAAVCVLAMLIGAALVILMKSGKCEQE